MASRSVTHLISQVAAKQSTKPAPQRAAMSQRRNSSSTTKKTRNNGRIAPMPAIALRKTMKLEMPDKDALAPSVRGRVRYHARGAAPSACRWDGVALDFFRRLLHPPLREG